MAFESNSKFKGPVVMIAAAGRSSSQEDHSHTDSLCVLLLSRKLFYARQVAVFEKGGRVAPSTPTISRTGRALSGIRTAQKGKNRHDQTFRAYLRWWIENN
jgi:hypothetical protein